jgi:hypothetical protein
MIMGWAAKTKICVEGYKVCKKRSLFASYSMSSSGEESTGTNLTCYLSTTHRSTFD